MPFIYFLRATCLSAFLFGLALMGPSVSFAQPVPDKVSDESQAKTMPEVSAPEVSTPKVSDSPSVAEAEQPAAVVAEESSRQPVEKLFAFPVEQHPWARFQPGAWCDLRIVSETFGDAGQVVGRSVTTQKEVLQAVANGKYVIRVQATVDLEGRRIIGDWKTHSLHLATDGAGQILESKLLDGDSPEGVETPPADTLEEKSEPQIWAIRYRDGDRTLMDRIRCDTKRYPFVLERTTLIDQEQPDGPQDTQLVTLTAERFPYAFEEQLLSCSCFRTDRSRPKGHSFSQSLVCSAVPGGKVAVWSTETDATDRLVRWSVTELIAYGEKSPEAASDAAEDNSTGAEGP